MTDSRNSVEVNEVAFGDYETVAKLKKAHRLRIAREFLAAMRAVSEETGYGSPKDCLSWAQRIEVGREF